MTLSEYIILFVFVLILGAGLPGPGDASLIAAGTLAGEGKLNVWIVLAVSMTAWMLGSVIGYKIGERGDGPCWTTLGGSRTHAGNYSPKATEPSPAITSWRP
jgi:membrane protein DedA with SNARE-associated domain